VVSAATRVPGSGFRSAITLLASLAIAACASGGATTSTSTRSPAPGTRRWTDSVLATMSLRDKAAQLVWPFILGDYQSTDTPAWRRIERLVTEQHVGGFIVSVGSPLDIAARTNALQRASQRAGISPLLFSADMETGAGFRARAGFFLPNAIDLGGATVFPLAMSLGAIGDTALAYKVGQVTAEEGRALGLHVSFGPVLDVNNNPANPVIGARSFGEDPKEDARLGAAYVRGIQEHGMVATGKHFPGHGDTETNSHLSLSTVTASRARLDSVELVPFKAAIAAGVGGIMTYHGILPALDSSGVPATLSPKVLGGLLREELRFRGLIITDAMDMMGVVEQFGGVEAAKRAVAAGADVLLMPADVPGTIDAVVAGVREGRYDEQRLDASVRRLLDLKARFALERQRTIDVERVRDVVGDTAHTALAREVAERGIVLAKDSLSSVPLRPDAARRPHVLSITYARRSDLGAGTIFDGAMRSALAHRYPSPPSRTDTPYAEGQRDELLRSEYAGSDDADVDFARLLRLADSADVVVVGSYVNISSSTATTGAPKAFADFVRILAERAPGRTVLVSFGTPYLLQQIPSAPAYLIAWGGSPASQQAAARALLGQIPITARLPIRIPPYLPVGAGVSRGAK